MRALTFLPSLLAAPTVAGLIGTQFPHLLIPIVSNNPDHAFGTQFDATVSYSPTTDISHYTEISFNMPPNTPLLATCRLTFKINRDPIKNAPRKLSGSTPYLFNISLLEPTINKDTDTWNSHPDVLEENVASFELTTKGEIKVLVSKIFTCRENGLVQALMYPGSAERAFEYYWYELDYPIAQGGAHGVVLEMFD